MYLLHKLSSQFPCIQQYTYLNTPAYGLLSDTLMEWRQEQDLDYLVGGSRFKEAFYETLEALRDRAAQFLNASREEVFLVPNFSFGWKVLTCGLPKDIHFLLLDGDYPSLNWPVLTSGFSKLEKIKVSASMEEAIEEYFAAHAPDVFAFSVVQYLNGLKIDPGFIKKLKAAYPNTLFMADTTQYLGTEIFSFRDSGIDVLGCSGYKWLLAGTGNGLFLVKKEIQERFYKDSVKWEPRNESWLKNNSHLQNHLEPGHLDSLSMGSLYMAITYLENTGMEKIGDEVAELGKYAADLLYENGYLEESVYRRRSHAPFYSLVVNNKQLEALRKERVVFALRGGRLRIGFHFYNQKSDVDTLVRILNHSKSR